MEDVLGRPWVEEVEDYREYKRQRQLAREQVAEHAETKRHENLPALTVSADGTEETPMEEDDEDDETLIPTSFETKMFEKPSPPDSPLQDKSKKTFYFD